MIYKLIEGVPTPADIRSDFPNTSFPSDLSGATLPDGYMWAEPTTTLVVGQYETLTQGLPEEYEQGKWRGTWVITPWPQEDVDRDKREKFKQDRAEKVAAIKVDVDGLIFDGDETSQARMARAVVTMTDADVSPWVLADNTTILATKAQLSVALRKAGEEQTRLWVMPAE